MLELCVDYCARAVDLAAGWLLWLPWDAALAAVALATALLMVVIRRLLTDQNLLWRAVADDRQLRGLLRAAKKAGDREAVRRFRTTRSMIAALRLKAEGWPLVASLLPIAVLATWAMVRLEFHPPRAEEPLQVVLHATAGAVGQVVHLVPQEGVEAPGGWVAEILAAADDSQPQGTAVWTIRAEARKEPYRLVFRMKDRSLEHELLIGGRKYSPPLCDHGAETATEVRLQEAKLAGIVPGWPGVLPAWVVGYLLLAVVFTSALKRALRVK